MACVVSLIAIGISASVQGNPEPVPNVPKDLAGLWRVAYREHDGIVVTEQLGQYWLFVGPKLAFVQNEIVVWDFGCIYHTDGPYRAIDLIPYGRKSVELRSIYEIDDDHMRVCGSPHNGPRPKAFATRGTTNHVIYLSRDREYERQIFQRDRSAHAESNSGQNARPTSALD